MTGSGVEATNPSATLLESSTKRNRDPQLVSILTGERENEGGSDTFRSLKYKNGLDNLAASHQSTFKQQIGL